MGGRQIAFVAAVVFEGRAYVPAVEAVRCHVLSLGRCDVDDDAGAGRCERSFVEVVVSIEAGVGGEAGLTAGRSEEI